ncbi:MAG: hypothetical protein AAGD34_02310 [Pseudomonadota bacterium]
MANRATDRPQTIHVCYFGITRSLRFTLPSIEDNILKPARQRGPVRQFCHVFDIGHIDNPRSEERGSVDRNEHALLQADWLAVDTPPVADVDARFLRIKSYGDNWNDDFRSLRNLTHQLYSLKTVTDAALEDGAKICLFCRPDLSYHSSFVATLKHAMTAHARGEERVFVPNWQGWDGVNDRFAVCVGHEAITGYGRRWDVMEAYAKASGRPLQGESLLRYALAEQPRVVVIKVPLKASRVRLSGTVKAEDFRPDWLIGLYLRAGQTLGRARRAMPGWVQHNRHLRKLGLRIKTLTLHHVLRR